MIKHIKRDYPWVIGLLVCYYIIPYILLTLHDFQGVLQSPFDSIQSFLLWICIPLCGSIIALTHILHVEAFSPFLVLEAVVAVSTYLLWLRISDVLVLSLSVVFVLLLELFPKLIWLGRANLKGTVGSLFVGVAQDWKFLAQVFFWSVPMVTTVQLLLSGSSQYTPFGIVIFMSPFLIVMAVLPTFKQKPMTIGGLVSVLLLMMISILTATNFFMNSYWILYLIYVILGFAVLFLMDVLYVAHRNVHN